MVLQTAVLPKNKQYEGKTLGQIAKMQGKGIIGAFLDLVVEEHLDTEFLHGEINEQVMSLEQAVRRLTFD